jgi:putative endonuclease
MTWYVYIIRSLKDNRYYTGLTNNLFLRISQHNKGRVNTPSTYHRGPFVLVHAEEVETREAARKREKFWKSGSGRELRDKMVHYWVTSSGG